MKKVKGEVKISVKGNPYAFNPRNQWNFGVYKPDNMNIDMGIKQIMDLLKRLGKG